MIRPGVAALVVAITVASPLQAQIPDSLVASGVRAFRDLDFDAAAGFLARAVTLLEPTADTARRAEALTYLGATQVYRQRPDSAQAVFRSLVRLAPAYRIDRLIFPPEVTTVFDAARRATPAVVVRLQAEHRFRAGQPGFVGVLFGSTFHSLQVEIVRPDASVVRQVYTGAIADSLELGWDGRTTGGEPVRTGRYILAIASLDSVNATARILRIPLDVTADDPDTLPTPLIPAEDLLPERTGATGGLEALLGGILMGVTTAAGPAVIAPDASLSGGRLVVGGALVAIGVAGFITGRSSREIPENIATNERVRAAWQVRRDEVAAENARRRAGVALTVRVGIPQVIEREGS